MDWAIYKGLTAMIHSDIAPSYGSEAKQRYG
jgi:hypothetical protein